MLFIVTIEECLSLRLFKQVTRGTIYCWRKYLFNVNFKNNCTGRLVLKVSDKNKKNIM